jgi:hypothetical protein
LPFAGAALRIGFFYVTERGGEGELPLTAQ